jgi:acyl-homoserine lactone acylase PvdQ
VISGSRTKSGRLILANDPHRAARRRSGTASLEAPGFSVEGATLPGLPSVIIITRRLTVGPDASSNRFRTSSGS